MDYDANKDGKVGETEYAKMSERARQFLGEFKTLDTNGDGGITEKEWEAARQKLMERIRRSASPSPKK